MAFIGGAGTDEIVGPNAATDWQISQKNQGQVRGLNFEQVENLTGGTKVDTFEFLTNGSLSGKIEGLAGADILDFTALGAQDVRLSDIGSVDGFDGTTVGGTIGMGFANINAIAGSTSATTDKLTGIDATALWTIDSQTPSFTYQAKSRTLVFSNFEELTGGSKVDKFDVKATSFAMILNGEGDDDFFNFHSGDLDNYQGKVTIHGGADDNGQPDQRDRIYLDDQGGDNGEERFDYRLEPHSVTWLQTNFAPDRTFAGVYFDETMEFVRLDGTDGVNRFSVRPSEFTVFYVDGNEPGVEDCPPGGGDFLELDLAPLPPVDLNPVTGPKITFTEIVNGRQTKGVWTFDAPHKEVQFESIERFNLLDKLTVSDDAGFNSLPLIDVISPTTLTKYSDVVTNFSSEPLEAFSIFDYPVFQPGAMPASLERLDVNNDGMVSPKDLQILLDHLDEQPGQYDPRLDANRDGSVNVIDISSFLSAIIIEANKNHVVGGVRTTTADLNCDGLDEIIAVSGANLAPRIQVFNGVNGEPMSISQTIGDPSNTYGVYVSAGDFDGDGMVEIATSMERGSQAVTIWKWVDDHFEKVRSFDSGFDPNASGGVRVSTGDLNGDLTDEIIVSTGTGRNPGVSIFSGAGALLGVVQVDAAYGRGGITTTTGDLDGDGYDEILILAGRRGGSLLSYVPGSANIPANSTAILLGALYTGDDALSPLSGVTKDADGDGDDELFIGQLSDGRSSIVRKLEWNDAIDQFFDDGFFETDDEWTGDFLG
ncbi:dockerin type I domain-containing protein [Blastopirellula sp. JC732]|uniref:Dockerin type I domain-containing protein n=1 Tax=Blastopirellula sediminis TaxID=2894196 RepID=A0A9X1MLL8_9BACT|nr:FG-GAP-like repeat-containing protein [Blastopirellula sediminis]MCC9608377.1 dockerin type I domain-containing protein [Blastopirellula sediminis]MCC9628846.1 dockerin type I domain-containing protein [Blastopirellula sediminis]